MIGTGPSFYSKMVKKWKTWRQIGFLYGGIQLIPGWRKVWEKKKKTLAAFSIRRGEKKYKQVLLPFMIFYVAEQFVTGKYCSCQREIPREMKS